MIIGIANGCFDMLHDGHRELLAEARKQCDRLVVAINIDTSVKQIKGGHRPINHQGVRTRMLCGLEDVDEVRLFDTEDDLRVIIQQTGASKIFKGSDYAGKPVTGSDLAEVVIIDTPTKSSTWAELRKRGRL